MEDAGFFWYFADLALVAHSCHKIAGNMVNESRAIRISSHENHCDISGLAYQDLGSCQTGQSLILVEILDRQQPVSWMPGPPVRCWVQRTPVGQPALIWRGSAAALLLLVEHSQISGLGDQRSVSVIQ
jgi:hypothetical protein